MAAMKKQRPSYRMPRAHGPRVTVIGGGHGLSANSEHRISKYFNENKGKV